MTNLLLGIAYNLADFSLNDWVQYVGLGGPEDPDAKRPFVICFIDPCSRFVFIYAAMMHMCTNI